MKPGPPVPPDPNQLAPAEASEHADQVNIIKTGTSFPGS